MVKLNKKQQKILFITILVLFILLLFYSCSHRNNTGDLQRYIDKLRQESVSRLTSNKTKPQPIEMPPPVAYHDESLRPPFGEHANPASQSPALTKAEQANPLLAYSLSVLKFVGTLKHAGMMYAFILAPDGVIYQVKTGDEIDEHHDKIFSIAENELVIQKQPALDVITKSPEMITLRLKE